MLQRERLLEIVNGSVARLQPLLKANRSFTAPLSNRNIHALTQPKTLCAMLREKKKKKHE